MIGSKAGNGALLDSSTQPEDRLNQFLLPVEAPQLAEEQCHTSSPVYVGTFLHVIRQDFHHVIEEHFFLKCTYYLSIIINEEKFTKCFWVTE